MTKPIRLLGILLWALYAFVCVGADSLGAAYNNLLYSAVGVFVLFIWFRLMLDIMDNKLIWCSTCAPSRIDV